MEEAKVPLATSANGESVDYEALFRREGDQPKYSEKFAAKTAIGECRNPKRFHWFEWVFVAVTTCSFLAVIGLSIERFIHFEKTVVNISLNLTSNGSAYELAPCDHWTCTSDFIFAVALLVNLGFISFYCYDGLLRERPFEILAYVAGVIVIIVYTVGNFAFEFTRLRGSPDEGEFILRIVRFVLVLLIAPLNIALAMWSWWKMGFLVLTVIGANKTLTWAYRCRSFLLTLQWFSIQVLVNIFVLAWARDGQMLSLPEKVILVILVVYMFLLNIVGIVAVLWELHIATYFWYIMVIPYAAYCIYKMIRVSQDWSDYAEKYYVFNEGDEKPVTSTFLFVGAALLVACIIGVIVAVLLVVFMTITQKHFGKGLKDKIPPPFSKKSRKTKN